MNVFIGKGNLTRDPELRYTPKGTAVAGFAIAINRVWTNEAGEKKEEVDFIDCTAWGRTAEVIGQYFRKGRPILVQGRLQLEQWDDKQSGQKRSRIKVVLSGFEFCGGDNPEAGDRPAAPAGGSRGERRAADSRQAAEAPQDGPPEEEDSVPF